MVDRRELAKSSSDGGQITGTAASRRGGEEGKKLLAARFGNQTAGS
jgi:hypothetical protein